MEGEAEVIGEEEVQGVEEVVGEGGLDRADSSNQMPPSILSRLQGRLSLQNGVHLQLGMETLDVRGVLPVQLLLPLCRCPPLVIVTKYQNFYCPIFLIKTF